MAPLDFTRRYPCAPLTIFDTLTNFSQILSKSREIVDYKIKVYKDGSGQVVDVSIWGYGDDGWKVFEADILYGIGFEEYSWRVYHDWFNLIDRNFQNSL